MSRGTIRLRAHDENVYKLKGNCEGIKLIHRGLWDCLPRKKTKLIKVDATDDTDFSDSADSADEISCLLHLQSGCRNSQYLQGKLSLGRR